MLDLLRESVLTQSVLTLTLACAVVYLSVTGQKIPETLISAFWVVIGFYFGNKTQQFLERYGG